MKGVRTKFGAILAFVFAFLCFGGLFAVRRAGADTVSDWIALQGEAQVSPAGDDGFSTVTNITGSGNPDVGVRFAFAYKIHLDGATISFRDEGTLENGDFLGCYLVRDLVDPFPDSTSGGVVLNSRKSFSGGSLGSSQTRFGINAGWEVNKVPLTSYSLENMRSGVRNFGPGIDSLVTNNTDNWGLSVTFEHTEEEYWTIKIKQLFPGVIWSSGTNKGFDDRDTVTAYIPDTELASRLDGNGDVSVVFFATDNAVGEKKPAPQIKLEDSNGRDYERDRETLLAAARKAISDFNDAIDTVADYFDYVECTRLREQAENAVSRLRYEELNEQRTALEAAIARYEALDAPELTDREWINVGGSVTGGSVSEEEMVHGVFDPETRYVSLRGLEQWGRRAYYSTKIHLDGATIDLLDEGTTEDGDYWGFVLSQNTEGYFTQPQSPFAAVLSKGKYDNGRQTRFHIGLSHDFGQESFVWPTKDFTLGTYSKQFGVDNSLVLTDADTYGLSLHFRYVADSSNPEGGYWEITVKSLSDTASIWTGNNTANYNAVEKTSTVYVRPSKLNTVLDGNGDAYLIACGDCKEGASINYRIDDRNYRDYLSSKLQAATEKVEAYGREAETVSGEGFSAFLEKREALLAEFDTLRGNDNTYLSSTLRRYDKKLAENADVQTHLDGLLTEAYSAVKATAEGFSQETNISADAIASAREALDTAHATYAQYAAMLSSANGTKFRGEEEEIVYRIDLAETKLWLLEYEKNVTDLSGLSGEGLVRALMAAQAYRADYEGSETEEAVELLREGDKTAYEARIAAADATFGEIYAAQKDAVKERYLADFEETLNDASNKTQLRVAHEALVKLLRFEEIEEGDALYARFTAAKEKMNSACERYILNYVDGINKMLDENVYTTLGSFEVLKSTYGNIDKLFLDYCSQGTKTAFDEMEQRVYDHNLYYITVTGQPGYRFENTENGLYFEFLPTWSTRVNYNKLLDLEKGVTLEMTFDEYATLATANSNNIFINLLEQPNSYKSESDGLTLVLWLSDDSDISYVRVYSFTDVEIDYVAFRTPTEGQPFKISVQYCEDNTNFDGSPNPAYLISVNDGEATLVITEEQITSNGHRMPRQAYLSVGSASNLQVYTNAFTITAISEGNDRHDFSLPKEAPQPVPPKPQTPETTDPGTTDPGTTDPGTTDPGTTDPGTTDPGTTDPGTTEPGTDDEGCGAVGFAGAGGILALMVLIAAGIVITKKSKGGQKR